MNIHPKVTVIIPVYNVAAYLPQCLDSVIAQTLDDIEIICVNDGSKDESLAVLNEYAAQDSRIKIIDKANAGVSAARNDGIAAAQGEYIAFLDGDDFLEPDCLEKVYATAVSGNFDTVVFKHNLIDGNKKTVWNNSEFGCFDEDKLLYTFSAVIWNKLYRTAFLREKQIGFPLGLKIAEDTIFSLMCFFIIRFAVFVTDIFIITVLTAIIRQRQINIVVFTAKRQLINIWSRRMFFKGSRGIFS